MSGDGTIAIIGAKHLTTDVGAKAGAAYIFSNTSGTWSQVAKLEASDADAQDFFGGSVDISADGLTAVVGAYGEDTGGAIAGAVYVFSSVSETWTETAKIQSSNAPANSYFGHAVSISDDGSVLLVAAYGDSLNASFQGAAYIFNSDGGTWSQGAAIRASDAQASDFFGYSVAISGDGLTAVVGAYGEDTGVDGAGAAYIFNSDGGTWTESVKLQGVGLSADDRFGGSVSISTLGTNVIIGARVDDEIAGDSGAAYVFNKTGEIWEEVTKLKASDVSGSFWYFGSDVSLSGDGNTAIIGAFGTDAGVSAGSSYIFVNAAVEDIPA